MKLPGRDGRGVRRAGLVLALGWASVAAASGAVEAVPRVELVASGGWCFAAPPPATLAALERDWGQFELRLPVRGFAVPAPNCRGEIRLRWIALAPDASERAARFQARWALLERLKTLQVPGSTAALERVALDLRHYTRRGKDGTVELRYCNAFVSDAAP